MLYTFPAAGQYTLLARFQKDNNALAEAVFPLEVISSEDAPRKTGSGTLFLFFG